MLKICKNCSLRWFCKKINLIYGCEFFKEDLKFLQDTDEEFEQLLQKREEEKEKKK